MDINLPKLDGIAATREIKTKYPNIVVIGLTVSAEDYVLHAMLKAGASEVLEKGNVVNDLYRSIQRAVASAHPIVILEEDHAAETTTHRSAESTYPANVAHHHLQSPKRISTPTSRVLSQARSFEYCFSKQTCHAPMPALRWMKSIPVKGKIISG
jgi:DNA-binding NarL/FixJ family response regulator